MTELISEKYSLGTLHDIPLNMLQADPEQPRKHFADDALSELTNSIKKHGIRLPHARGGVSDTR